MNLGRWCYFSNIGRDLPEERVAVGIHEQMEVVDEQAWLLAHADSRAPLVPALLLHPRIELGTEDGDANTSLHELSKILICYPSV
jgi:hypothetical protein